MTPTRGKRNSKVPERFSSEDLRIETSNSNGVTIIDYNDKTTATTHRLTPIGTKIKLKPAMREPLKVKLPKLKRPASEIDSHLVKIRVNKVEDSSATQPNDLGAGTTRINKIKLPSLSKNRTPTSGKQHQSKSLSVQTKNEKRSDSSKSVGSACNETQLIVAKSQTAHGSNAALSSDSECSFEKLNSSTNDEDVLNSSSSSDDNNSSGMQIIMSNRAQIDISNSDGNNNTDSGIRCPCGVDADLGVMVECEKCSTWQHGHCINVGPEEDAYEGYICAFCLYPPGKQTESLHQLTVNDRFRKNFDQLSKSMTKQAEKNDSEKLNNENRVYFSLEELSEATKDLKRVANSLDVKWKLYVHGEYPADLKIWSNAIWSPNHEENMRQQQTTCFFGDMYRGNLELNIRNIVRKIAERIELIKNQISTSSATGEKESEGLIIKINNSLDEVNRLIDQVKMHLNGI